MPARILIVEDNPANLKLMAYLLRAFGHTILTATDGEEAFTVLGAESLDLIVCDVHLPRVDGYEVVRRLKANDSLRTLPVVAVTALAMVGDREKVLAGGFDGYISKPIMPQTFVPQVEAFLAPELRGQRTAAIPPTASHPAAPQKPRGTVLAVDNTPANLEVFRKTLEPFGFRVLAVQSVALARAALEQTCPDMILSDLHMPEEDGFDLIRAVKADPRFRDVPFVFISASVWKEQDRIEAERLGATKFLLRPITPQALLAEVQAIVPARKEG